MSNYRRVGKHWEVIPESEEKNTILPEREERAIKQIDDKLTPDNLAKFNINDSPADFILKLFIPRYYNDGSKVSPNVIADIMYRLSDELGGTSTYMGKGYWTNEDILYEDKNIYTEILLKGYSMERATAFGKYLSTIIAQILKQEASFYILVPAYSEYVDKQEFDEAQTQSVDSIEELNRNEQMDE